MTMEWSGASSVGTPVSAFGPSITCIGRALMTLADASRALANRSARSASLTLATMASFARILGSVDSEGRSLARLGNGSAFPTASAFWGTPDSLYSPRAFPSLMWWTAPTLRHRSAIGWLCRNATTLRGAVHGPGYHDRGRYCEVGVSDSRRRC